MTDEYILRLTAAEWSELMLLVQKVNIDEYDPDYIQAFNSLAEKVKKAPVTK